MKGNITAAVYSHSTELSWGQFRRISKSVLSAYKMCSYIYNVSLCIFKCVTSTDDDYDDVKSVYIAIMYKCLNLVEAFFFPIIINFMITFI